MAATATRTIPRTGVTDLHAREAAIVALLERHAELTEPGNGRAANGGEHVPLMPHAPTCRITKSSPPRCTCWRRDVAEVERLLALMRNRAKQEAFGGESLGTLRFHMLAWYVTPGPPLGVWQPKPIRKGRKLKLPVGQDILRDLHGRTVPAEYVLRQPRRHPDARKPKADLGVAWMAAHWQLGHEPMRPVEEAA